MISATALRAAAQPYALLFEAAGRKYAVPPALLAAIAYQESRYTPTAFNPERDNNPSLGLMQIRVSTAKGLGFTGSLSELYQPALSVELAAKLLRDNFARIRRDAPGLPAREIEDRAIAAYNAGWSKIRPGDAPRTAGGAFINQAAYVAPVRAYYSQLSTAIAPASSPAPSSSGPTLQPAASHLQSPAAPGAIAPGAIIAALLLVTLLVASRSRREGTLLAVTG